MPGGECERHGKLTSSGTSHRLRVVSLFIAQNLREPRTVNAAVKTFKRSKTPMALGESGGLPWVILLNHRPWREAAPFVAFLALCPYILKHL